MSEPRSPADVEVRTYFARGRNALVARAEFSELYAAFYLHQMDCGIRLDPAGAQLARDALAAITLHCASRPPEETTAWTVNFQSPMANVFAAGDNALGTVVAHVHTDHVKPAKGNVFYADVAGGGRPPRRSVAAFDGSDFLPAVENFYRQSEQRPVRIFRKEEEDLVLIAAQPDCDLNWLESLDAEAIRNLDKNIELRLLEQRTYRFQCGCNQDRMLTMLAPMMRTQSADLFQGEETLRISCPRCGARHTITKENLEAHLAGGKT